MHLARFDKGDANGDGTVTQDEIEAIKAKHQQKRAD